MRCLTRRSQGHVLRRRGDLDRHAEVAQCVEAGGQAFEHSFDAARARFPRGLVALVNDTLYAVGDEDIFRRVPLLQKPYRLDEMARLVQRMLGAGKE